MGLFGSKYPATDKIEKEEVRLRNLYHEVLETSGSEELKEYFELDKVVNTDEFQNAKRQILNLKFNRTKEYDELKRYNKLRKDRKLKKFLLIDGSQELSDYNKFKSTEAYALINDKKERKKNSELLKFYKFENSRNFRIYKEILSGSIPEEYQHLKEKVNSDEFLTYKSFCENKKRWETTPEYASEKRYNELKSDIKIMNYLQHHDSDIFDEFKHYEITFEDDFTKPTLNDSKWNTSFLWADKYANGNYTQANENHGYIDSKNIGIIGSKLTLTTRRDEHNARVWDPKKGFVLKDVDYSSGVISSGEYFNQKEGIFKVKIKTSGKFPIGHSIILCSDKNEQNITLFKSMGNKKMYVGYSMHVNGSIDANHALVNGFNPNKGYYILSVEWDANILVWKVNGVKVYSCRSPKDLSKLHFTAYSFVEKSKKKTDSGSLEFDWIKAYKKVSQ